MLTILGLPSEWVWPWVLISDSSIRKNFSASMAVPHSLHFDRAMMPNQGFGPSSSKRENGFFAWVNCFVASSPRNRITGSLSGTRPTDGQGKTAKLQGNFLSEAYEITVILRNALTVARPIATESNDGWSS